MRFLLDNVTLLKTQIRAILRAGVNGNIRLMVPMIASIKEVMRIKEIIQICKQELEVAQARQA